MSPEAGRDGGVVTAGGANEKTSRRGPRFGAGASRTCKTVRPAKLREVLPARSVSGKPDLKLGERTGIILHSRIHYMWGVLESSEYPTFQ